LLRAINKAGIIAAEPLTGQSIANIVKKTVPTQFPGGFIRQRKVCDADRRPAFAALHESTHGTFRTNRARGLNPVLKAKRKWHEAMATSVFEP
jgi:hypothetical protein